MKGGARARSGPAPDPNALRRDRKDDADWITLPTEGREGSPPAWPLPEPTDRESDLWADLWSRPQAVMWERNGQELEVAMFVRSFGEAEKPGATKGSRDLVRMGLESLGLSLPGLARNRWRIEPGEDAKVAPKRTKSSSSAKSRFKVLDGGAA